MTNQEALLIMNKMDLFIEYGDRLDLVDMICYAEAAVELSKRIQCFTDQKINETDSAEDQIETATEITKEFIEENIMSKLNIFQIVYVQQCLVAYAEKVQNIAYKLMALDGQTTKFTVKL